MICWHWFFRNLRGSHSIVVAGILGSEASLPETSPAEYHRKKQQQMQSIHSRLPLVVIFSEIKPLTEKDTPAEGPTADVRCL